MKGYEFPLGTVLRARRAQESIARAGLQKANLATAAAEGSARQSLAHYEQVIGVEGSSFMAQRERSELAASALLGAQESVVVARDAAVIAMNTYLLALRAVSVLERLDDRRRDEYQLAVQHEEAVLVDELVTGRYVRQQRRLRNQRAVLVP